MTTSIKITFLLTLAVGLCACGGSAPKASVTDVMGFLADHKPQLLPSPCPVPALRFVEVIDTDAAAVDIAATITPKCDPASDED